MYLVYGIRGAYVFVLFCFVFFLNKNKQTIFISMA